MTEAESNEKKLNCEDYEEMMADSAAKRAADSKSLAQREGARADNLSNVEESLTDEIKALAAGIVALDKSVAEATEQRNVALLLRLLRRTPRSLRRAVVLLP